MPIYYPYFRGRQNELLAIRDCATLCAEADFAPIIEPVKSSLNGLERTLAALKQAEADGFVIVNPQHGDHSSDGRHVEQCLENHPNLGVGIMALTDSDPQNVADRCRHYQSKGRKTMVLHAGYTDGKDLARRLGEGASKCVHVFSEKDSGKRYRSHFDSSERVLIADGFTKKVNREYAKSPVEQFSELHLVFREEGMSGFGDYLIAGNEYNESGGPAYAIAIHLTFVDQTRDNVMYVQHFVSDTVDTPTDPAGKFAEALTKLVKEVTRTETPILRTKPVEEFLDLHSRGHFPGLGYVKKLSMLHHVETLAKFFKSEKVGE